MKSLGKNFDEKETMVVDVPIIPEHDGCCLWVRPLRISKYCPKCGAERGKPFKGRSYDGSRSVVCDMWNNPCGHVDKYTEVVEEAEKLGILAVSSKEV